MQRDATLTAPVVWSCPNVMWGLLAGAAFCVGTFFHPGLVSLYGVWTSSDEYSFGIFIPFISLFMLWQQRERLALIRFEASWLGVVVLVVGLALGALAQLASTATITLYAFLISLAGLALAFVGRRGFAAVAAPLAMLILMLPLPDVLFRELSQALQLVSSRFGVAMLRAAGVSVFLEGNIIDLGSMKLQVAEACSGLRYLFSLVALGVVAAYFFRAAMWQRLLLVVSTLPITVLMNSVRIALVGITVEHFGLEAAEGVLHAFEGLVVFMGCMVILIGLMWLMARLSGRKLQDSFVLTLPAPKHAATESRIRAVPATLGVAAALLAGAAAAHLAIPPPESVTPARRDFTYFPQELGDWRGRPEAMEKQFLDALQLDDYLLADYFGRSARAVNAYVAYYASQTQRLHDHSPRECMPFGGWEILTLERHVVPGVTVASQPLEVNRVIIQKLEARQLVYYWFKQRERSLTRESSLKFYILWDMISRQRSDGALVRLVTPMVPGEPDAVADERLAAFASELVPRLPDYVPD